MFDYSDDEDKKIFQDFLEFENQCYPGKAPSIRAIKIRDFASNDGKLVYINMRAFLHEKMNITLVLKPMATKILRDILDKQVEDLTKKGVLKNDDE